MIRRMAAEYDPSSINFRAIAGAVRGRTESEVRARRAGVLLLSSGPGRRRGQGRGLHDVDPGAGRPARRVRP